MAATTTSWDDLRVLEAVARLGDVRAAARELGLTASTLYRRLAALETSTGTRLLVRGAGPTALTEAARALASVASRVRGDVEGAIGDVRRGHDDEVGEVSLTTVEGMLPFLEAPLAALADRHPGLAVRLHLGDSGPSVRRREVDVALGLMERPAPSCWGRRLFRFRYGVFGTREALRREPLRWLVLGEENARQPESAFERRHASRVVLRTNARMAMLASMRAGNGVALLPRPLAALHDELIEARAYRAEAEKIERTAWVLTHEARRSLPRVMALVRVLSEHLVRVPGAE